MSVERVILVSVFAAEVGLAGYCLVSCVQVLSLLREARLILKGASTTPADR